MANIKALIILVFLNRAFVDANVCTALGRFPDRSVPDCQGYVMCIQRIDGTFTTIPLKCPPHSIFSSVDSRCVQGECYNLSEGFNCTETGSFGNYDDENCTSYIHCVQGTNGVLEPRIVLCPENTIFDSKASKCITENDFTCMQQQYGYIISEFNLTASENNTFERAFDKEEGVVSGSAIVAYARWKVFIFIYGITYLIQ